MDCLEEFEVRRPDLFDMVELQSIDDRLELSKLMLTVNNQQSPTWYVFFLKFRRKELFLDFYLQNNFWEIKNKLKFDFNKKFLL